MKLTTKIVLGIIISIFLLSMGFIIGLSFIDMGKYELHNQNVSNVSQGNIITISVEPYQTIRIDKTTENSDIINFFTYGTIQLKPVINEKDKNKLSMPEELLRSTDITSSNDTLIIQINTDKLYEQYKKEVNWQVIEDINYFLYTNTVDVICNLSGIKVDIRNMETERIKINTYGDINIDSCQTNLIEPYMNKGRKFLLKNSQVKELNIDLDKIGSTWLIENCNIDVENLTGSGNHRTNLSKSEAKTMNWIPKNADARLTVNLQGDTAKVMFPK